MKNQMSVFTKAVLDGNEKIKREMIEHEASNKDAIWKRICPPEFQAEWDDAKCKANCNVIAQIKTWNYSAKGMFICGPSGFCKTRAVWYALKFALRERHSLYFIDGSKFAEKAGEFYGANEQGPWIDSMVAAAIFFLDDMGKRVTPSMVQALFTVIDRRTSHHLPCILTANLTMGQLGDLINDKTLSDPLRRRIMDHLSPIAV